jgi:ABC-2 type transport system ATP-binding protein
MAISIDGQRNEEMTPLLHMQQVTKMFGQKTAVHSLDLDVFQGDVLGLLGPNGSGKTTTLRMALGLIAPSHGTIELFGQEFSLNHQSPDALRHVGALIEYPVFYPYLSAHDNLRIMAMLSGWEDKTKIELHIKRALQEVNLTRYANETVKRYSLGMKQRLGIAVALLIRPKLVILDEPTNGLDPAGILEMRALLSSLIEQGLTIIISSHLLYEVQQTCNRVIILKDGCLLAQGKVSDLLSKQGVISLVLASAEQAEQAIFILNNHKQQDAPWIQEIRALASSHQSSDAVLEIHAPLRYSGMICQFLTKQEIYPSELRRQEMSLEQVFFSITNTTPNFPTFEY